MAPVKDALKICRTLVEDTQVRGLIPSITQTVGTHTVTLAPRSRDAGSSGVQGHLHLYGESEASPSYTRVLRAHMLMTVSSLGPQMPHDLGESPGPYVS